MVNLRVHKKKGNYNEELKQQIKNDLRGINAELSRLYAQKKILEKDLLELEIKPFKIGDYALIKVPSGKSYKEQKCLLECGEYGTLYARPVKADGELSGRHFIVTPVDDRTYSDILKEV